MLAKVAAASACLVAAASAFTPAAPLGLRMASTSAVYSTKNSNIGPAYGPVITIFDNRGCTQHTNKEYTGPKTGNKEQDELVVKVANQKIPYPTEEVVEEIRRENLAYMGNKNTNLDYNVPQITIFDHRGCSRPPKEYSGKRTGGPDDEMLVRVGFSPVPFDEKYAESVLAQVIGTLKNA